MQSATTSVLMHKLRAMTAAATAVTVREAAEVLFEQSGKHMLPLGVQQGLRECIEKAAVEVTKEILPESIELAARAASQLARTGGQELALVGGRELGKAASREVLKTAAVEVCKGIGRAAAVGLILDGAIAGAEAVREYSSGRLTGVKACKHVVIEAGTGAAAAGGGVAAAAGVIIVTGGMAVPVVAVVAICSSVVVKLALKKLFW